MELLDYINDVRENAGLEPLRLNPGLSKAARFKAQSMRDLGYFSPRHPVYGLIENITRGLFGVDHLSASGVILRWYPTSQFAMNSLMSWPPDVELILNPDFTDMGIGSVIGEPRGCRYANFWVQLFAEIDDLPDIPHSEIILPNRRLTPEELSQWIAEYHAMGGINEFELEVLRLTNIERVNHGLSPLALNPTVMMSARFKSQSMDNLNYFSHTSPVYGEFINISLELFGIRIFGENLARSQRTPQEVVDGWMASPGHRENILNPSFTQLGVGFFNGHWTQKFGNAATVNSANNDG